MSKNLTHHRRVGADIDLSGGMTVSQDVCPEYFRIDSGALCIFADAMANASAGQHWMRNSDADEDLTIRCVWRSYRLQVICQCSGNWWEERQLDGNFGFRSVHLQDALTPVYVLEAKAQHLCSTEPICGHHQEHGVVPLAYGMVAMDLFEKLAHLLPSQRTRRPIRKPHTRSDNTIGQFTPNPSRRSEETEEGPQ